MNLFLTEDGVLKLGYYGLTTQAECYSIKGMNCDGVRSFASEVFKGEYKRKSDVWSFGIALIEMMGIRPYDGDEMGFIMTVEGGFAFPFKDRDIVSEEMAGLLRKCFMDYRHEARGGTVILSFNERWSVKRLMNVGVM